MKQEKYSVRIQREALVCNNNGKPTKLIYPKTFGDSEKNNFIKLGENKYSLYLRTPISKSVNEAYNKLVEITNVVILELYNKNNLIWPFSINGNYESKIKLDIKIDKEYYEELKENLESLPNGIKSAYNRISKNFEKRKYLLENIYGKMYITIQDEFLSVSNINLNPLDKTGITENDLYYLITFLFECLIDSNAKTLKELNKELLKVSKTFGLKSQNAIENVLSKGSISNQLEHAKKLMLEGYRCRYSLNKYKKLVAESIANIKDAISQGIDYEVLNEAKSVVQFDLNGHKEFVIEGNKTDRDSYIFPIITDDKYTAKMIMAEHGINVPKAILLDKDMDSEDIENLVSQFYNSRIVIKPRNTNYGIGITVFSKPATKKQILNAIDYAFKFDTNVLVEQYQKGMEYRFLVIDGKCLSVAHRRAASVVGDGKSTIEELIKMKNKEDWHALTGTPVKMDEPVIEYLKLQNLNLKSIPSKGRRITLRSNSNCSTGGESVDYTDTMPTKFKKIAEKAAKAFNGKICGVDIIIEDFNKDSYAIIEINDNPGYSINEWPYEGKGERIGLSVLNLLGVRQ